MLILNVRLQLRFLYSRQWRVGDPLHLCTYVPVHASALPALVTSDDGTCGNDTAIYVFEHVLYNPRLDTGNNMQIEVLRQIAEQTVCLQTRDLLGWLAVYLRHGNAAPLQQGHLQATVRRTSGRGDHEGRHWAPRP